MYSNVFLRRSLVTVADNCCPICFNSFLAILASEEMALAMDSPAVATEDLGLTRLADTCGHIFCRKEYVC